MCACENMCTFQNLDMLFEKVLKNSDIFNCISFQIDSSSPDGTSNMNTAQNDFSDLPVIIHLFSKTILKLLESYQYNRKIYVFFNKNII